MAIYKRCDRCGALIPPASVCKCRQRFQYHEYDMMRRDKGRKAFYNSTEWKWMRDKVMTRDEGVDWYTMEAEGKLEAATMVHHIEPLAENWERRLDPTNLISLSSAAHNAIHAAYDSSEEEKAETQRKLKKIAETRESQTI